MLDDLLVYVDGNYVKGNEAKISVFDHGLLYGDGIFEGIRAYNGRVFMLKEHIDRFFASAKAIFLELKETKEEIEAIVIETCKKNNLKDSYIRLVATRGKGDLGLDPRNCKGPTIFCIAATIALYPPELYETGIEVITSTLRRNKATIVDPQIKSLNYLNNILAKAEAVSQGCIEAILLNHDGIVAECTGDNIFIVKNGAVYTPPVYIGVLDGITRSAIFGVCERLNIPIFEKEFTLFNVYNADECFLTGTAAEVIAVTKADKRVIGEGVAGAVTQRILKEFRTLVTTTGVQM